MKEGPRTKAEIDNRIVQLARRLDETRDDIEALRIRKELDELRERRVRAA